MTTLGLRSFAFGVIAYFTLVHNTYDVLSHGSFEMAWFEKLSVPRRFLLIGLVLLPLLFGLGGTGIWGTTRINAFVQEANHLNIPSIYTLDRLTENVFAARLYARQTLLEYEPNLIQAAIVQMRDKKSLARQFWEEYTRLPHATTEKETWTQFEKTWQQWEIELDDTGRLALLNTLESKRQGLDALNRRNGTRLVEITHNLTDANYAQTVTFARDAQTTFGNVLAIIIISAVAVIGVCVAAGFLLAHSLIRFTTDLQHLNSRIRIALSDIERKRAAGQKLSQQIKVVSAELTATASQQASGSHQQVIALTQALDSLLELAQSAQVIADNVTQINQTADVVSRAATRVSDTAVLIIEVGKHGQRAVETTLATNAKVETIYAGVVQLLIALLERASALRQVNNLIRSMSDETHLLALNAAIEAAGARQDGGRFAIVAGAVKTLSERSVAASQNVRDLLGDLERRIQQTVLTAESGLRDTHYAVTVAHESGTVMGELVHTLEQNMQDMLHITEAMATMTAVAQEIRAATTQQGDATRQSVETLQEIGAIARQTAGSSTQVTRVIEDLDGMVGSMAETLAA